MIPVCLANRAKLPDLGRLESLPHGFMNHPEEIRKVPSRGAHLTDPDPRAAPIVIIGTSNE